MDLIELARIRQERAGQKYVLPNGENMANYRDCGLDIMEELADAWNIANLWERRLDMDDDRIRDYLTELRLTLQDAAWYTVTLRNTLPEEFRQDLIPVDRVARLED
jgi:hypothetical protein